MFYFIMTEVYILYIFKKNKNSLAIAIFVLNGAIVKLKISIFIHSKSTFDGLSTRYPNKPPESRHHGQSEAAQSTHNP